MGYFRRLPIYLLLDCSDSMVGEAFNAMKRGLDTMIGELRKDPQTREFSTLSVITMANSACQIAPLTEPIIFSIPELKIGSGPAIIAALELLEKSIAQEVRKTSPERKGDWPSQVFIFTDGKPTDRWVNAARWMHERWKIAGWRAGIAGRPARIIGVACGPDADIETLGQITNNVGVIKSSDEVSFREFFRWGSPSIGYKDPSILTANQGLECSSEQSVTLPNLPQDCLDVVKKSETQ